MHAVAGTVVVEEGLTPAERTPYGWTQDLLTWGRCDTGEQANPPRAPEGIRAAEADAGDRGHVVPGAQVLTSSLDRCGPMARPA
jgi:hypothetical protein